MSPPGFSSSAMMLEYSFSPFFNRDFFCQGRFFTDKWTRHWVQSHFQPCCLWLNRKGLIKISITHDQRRFVHLLSGLQSSMGRPLSLAFSGLGRPLTSLERFLIFCTLSLLSSIQYRARKNSTLFLGFFQRFPKLHRVFHMVSHEHLMFVHQNSLLQYNLQMWGILK